MAFGGIFDKKKKKNPGMSDFDEGYGDDYYGGNAQTANSGFESSAYPTDNDGVTPVSSGAFTPVEPLDSAAYVAEPAITPMAKPAQKPAIKCYAPKTYKDNLKIVGDMRNGSVVLLKVDGLERDQLIRLFDYLMGAAQALEFDMDKIGRTNVVISPKGADISDIIAMADLNAEDDEEYAEEEDAEEEYSEEEEYGEEEYAEEEFDAEDGEYEEGYDENGEPIDGETF